MRFLCVVGTRPEAIKLAPVILELARHSHVTTLCSGQHTALAEEPLAWFGIEPDDRIAIDPESRTLAVLTGALFAPLETHDRQAQAGCDRGAGRHDDRFGDGVDRVLCRHPVCACRSRPAHRQSSGAVSRRVQPGRGRQACELALFVRRSARSTTCARKASIPARIFLTGNTGIDALRLTLARIEQAARGPPRICAASC